jgi:GT2 family glycosyltransferase
MLTTYVEGQIALPVEFLYPEERFWRGRLLSLPSEIVWVLGANVFLRKDSVDTVRGFDESFVIYSEETDLCLRLRSAGYKIEYVSDLFIGHLDVASEEGSLPRAVWRRKTEGLYYLCRKHYLTRDFVRLLRGDRARGSFCGSPPSELMETKELPESRSSRRFVKSPSKS